MAFQWTSQASNPNINPDVKTALDRLAELAYNQAGVNLYGTSGARNWGNNSLHEQRNGANAADVYFGSDESGTEFDNPEARSSITPILSKLAQGVGLNFLDEGNHLHLSNAQNGASNYSADPAPDDGSEAYAKSPYANLKAPQLYNQIMSKYNAKREVPKAMDSAAMQLQMMIAAGEGGKLRGSDYQAVAPYAQSLAQAHAQDQKMLADIHNREFEQQANAELMAGLGILNQDGKNPQESFALGTLAPALMPFVKATNLDAGQQATLAQHKANAAQSESHFQQSKAQSASQFDTTMQYRKERDAQVMAAKGQGGGVPFGYDTNIKAVKETLKELDGLDGLSDVEKKASWPKLYDMIQSAVTQMESQPDKGQNFKKMILDKVQKLYPQGPPQ